MHFHGINYYSRQPDKLFEFYKTLGLRVVQEKESEDYYGAALTLSDGAEPVLWIWAVPPGEEQPCCNHLYFTTEGKVPEVYARLRAAGISCPEPVSTFWGGMELIVTDPDGNPVLFT